MSELPRLRRGDCGHFMPADSPPAGKAEDGHHDVYLCDDCRARLNTRRVETKPLSTLEFTAKKAPDFGQALPPAERGKVAALAGDARKVPDDLGHARAAPAREWLAGYDEAKGAAPTESPEA